jgi:hypothetical protein
MFYAAFFAHQVRRDAALRYVQVHALQTQKKSLMFYAAFFAHQIRWDAALRYVQVHALH